VESNVSENFCTAVVSRRHVIWFCLEVSRRTVVVLCNVCICILTMDNRYVILVLCFLISLASKVTEISKISVGMYVSDHFVDGKLQFGLFY